MNGGPLDGVRVVIHWKTLVEQTACDGTVAQ